MRLLVINEAAGAHTGGKNRLVIEMLEHLAREGHVVALAHTQPEATGLQGKVYDLARADSLETGLIAAIKDFRPEFIQVHNGELGPIVRPLLNLRASESRKLGICVFLHDQSVFCSGDDRMDRNLEPCHKPHGLSCLFWHYAQGCGGKSPRGNWVRWKRVQDDRGILLNPGIRIQVASQFMKMGLIENGFEEERIDVLPLFSNLPISSESPQPGLLLVAARFVRAKGVHLFLDALAQLRQSAWSAVVAGTGPEQHNLHQRARRLGLSESVEFTGELTASELSRWYSRCEIVINPSLRPEPFGLVGLEALAHGKPTISFAGGGVPEWLVDGRTGISVFPKTASTLAQAISTLLEDNALRQAMGKAASKHWGLFSPALFINRSIVSLLRSSPEFNSSAPTRPASQNHGGGQE